MKLAVLVIAGFLAVSTNAAPGAGFGPGMLQGGSPVPSKFPVGGSGPTSDFGPGGVSNVVSSAGTASSLATSVGGLGGGGDLPFPFSIFMNMIGSGGDSGGISGFDLGSMCNSIQSMDFEKYFDLQQWADLKTKFKPEEMNKIAGSMAEKALLASLEFVKTMQTEGGSQKFMNDIISKMTAFAGMGAVGEVSNATS